ENYKPPASKAVIDALPTSLINAEDEGRYRLYAAHCTTQKYLNIVCVSIVDASACSQPYTCVSVGISTAIVEA
ncbi:hypothetical protein SARC_06190, partial [Sphaeroforma arctica JP610]